MEERNLRSLHKKTKSIQVIDNMAMTYDSSFTNNDISNQKYMTILKDFVQTEHVWKLLKWVGQLSEDQKKVSCYL